MAAIARRAGVGAATLFRRFPDRRSLIDEVFSTPRSLIANLSSDECRGRPGSVAWPSGDSSTSSAGCRSRIAGLHRGLHHGTITRDSGVNERSNHAQATFAKLVCRAQDAGRLRWVFDPSDLVLIFFANSGVSAAPPDTPTISQGGSSPICCRASRRKGATTRNRCLAPSRMALKDVFESAFSDRSKTAHPLQQAALMSRRPRSPH